MEKLWNRFVMLDAFVTLGGILIILGYYFYCLVVYSDAFLLGAVIMFFMDLFGLALLAIAAALLLFSWRKHSHIGVLAGILFQLFYGVPYLCFVSKVGTAFLTPCMMGCLPATLVGAAGLIVCLMVPKSRRGWD